MGAIRYSGGGQYPVEWPSTYAKGRRSVLGYLGQQDVDLAEFILTHRQDILAIHRDADHKSDVVNDWFRPSSLFQDPFRWDGPKPGAPAGYTVSPGGWNLLTYARSLGWPRDDTQYPTTTWQNATHGHYTTRNGDRTIAEMGSELYAAGWDYDWNLEYAPDSEIIKKYAEDSGGPVTPATGGTGTQGCPAGQHLANGVCVADSVGAELGRLSTWFEDHKPLVIVGALAAGAFLLVGRR